MFLTKLNILYNDIFVNTAYSNNYENHKHNCIIFLFLVITILNLILISWKENIMAKDSKKKSNQNKGNDSGKKQEDCK